MNCVCLCVRCVYACVLVCVVDSVFAGAALFPDINDLQSHNFKIKFQIFNFFKFHLVFSRISMHSVSRDIRLSIKSKVF